jgi:hypothetical protein
MLKTMGELSERVDELQARVETLENEKREAQHTQEKLQADIKRLERSAAASTLNPPATPASPAMASSALPPQFQRNGLPTTLPPTSVIQQSGQQQQQQQRSSPQSSNVFDLSQPPPAHAAPPRPASSPKPQGQPQQQQAHPSPIMSAQPNMCVISFSPYFP